ncbi:hypothetical protein BJV77DRAFT_963859 [Russula vinacea]|nr:hypothetical protein BJV77DRAFT_963859 [Russula vinacea]
MANSAPLAQQAATSPHPSSTEMTGSLQFKGCSSPANRCANSGPGSMALSVVVPGCRAEKWEILVYYTHNYRTLGAEPGAEPKRRAQWFGVGIIETARLCNTILTNQKNIVVQQIVAFTVTIHLAHVIETGERRERFREDRAGEMGSEGDQGGDVTWGVSTSMCSWYSHSRFPMQRGRLEYRIAGQTCGVWWALAAQHQSGRALSYLRQGAKFNDVRCPHRVVLDVSTPALDMKGFRLSQRREAPPPTQREAGEASCRPHA